MTTRKPREPGNYEVEVRSGMWVLVEVRQYGTQLHFSSEFYVPYANTHEGSKRGNIAGIKKGLRWRKAK